MEGEGLSIEQYDAELRSLRLSGPVGEVPTKSGTGLLIVYRGPDRRNYFLRPADRISPADRLAEIATLRSEIMKAGGQFPTAGLLPRAKADDG